MSLPVETPARPRASFLAVCGPIRERPRLGKSRIRVSREIEELSVIALDHSMQSRGFSSANTDETRVPGPCPKSGMAERDKLIVGARAPSPAMSAKRETVTASRSLRLSVLRALRRATAPALPVLTGSFHIGSTFWAKPAALVILIRTIQ